MDVQSDGERETEEGGGEADGDIDGPREERSSVLYYSNGNNKFYLTSIAYTHTTSLQLKTCD